MNKAHQLDKKDYFIISKIANRAVRELGFHISEKVSLSIDIEKTHEETPLDLLALLTARTLDFAHDVHGISNHMNRETGKIENSFLPRYAIHN